MRKRPDGSSRRPRTRSSASRTSPIAGSTRAIKSSPASVSARLRVVRFNSRTPSRSSSARSRWLRLETEMRWSRAARRKFFRARHGNEDVEIAKILVHCSIM
jgi:hypothetical protein